MLTNRRQVLALVALSAISTQSASAQVRYDQIGSFIPSCVSNGGHIVGGYTGGTGTRYAIVVGAPYTIPAVNGLIQAMSSDGSVMGGVLVVGSPFKLVNGAYALLDTHTMSWCANVSDDGNVLQFSNASTSMMFDQRGGHLLNYRIDGASSDGLEWYGNYGHSATAAVWNYNTNHDYTTFTSFGGGRVSLRTPDAVLFPQAGGDLYGVNSSGYGVDYSHGGAVLNLPSSQTRIFASRNGRFIGTVSPIPDSMGSYSKFWFPFTRTSLNIEQFADSIGAHQLNVDLSGIRLTGISEDGLAMVGYGFKRSDSSLVAWRLIVPIALSDHFNVPPNTISTFNVMANDPSYLNAHAVLVDSTTHGSITLNSDGSASYNPAANYLGRDEFTYFLQDANGVTSTTVPVVIHVGAPASLTLSANQVYGLHNPTVKGTVTLNFTAFAPVVVTLKSTHPERATVPASVTVPAGSNSATFDVQQQAVTASSQGNTTIAAAYNTIGLTQNLNVVQAKLISLSLSQTQIVGAGTIQATLTSNYTSDEPVTVQLASNRPDRATVPATATIPNGGNSVTFNVLTVLPKYRGQAVISAKADGTTVSAVITVLRDMPVSLDLNPPIVVASGTSTGTVTLATPAPAGGIDVFLETDNEGIISIPGGYTVPAGQSGFSFPIQTLDFGSTTITATAEGVSVSATMVSAEPAIKAITPLDKTISGNTISVRADFTGPEIYPGLSLTVDFANRVILVPVPQGASSVTFQETMPVVDSTTVAGISISYRDADHGGGAIFNVHPATIASMACNPKITGGGSNVNLVLNLTGQTAVARTVSISSDQPTIVPAVNLIVPAGVRTATLPVPSLRVTSSVTVTLHVSYHSSSGSTTVTLRPAQLSALVLEESTVPSGYAAVCDVMLDGAAPAAGALVTLTTSDSSVATVRSSIGIAPGTLMNKVLVNTKTVASVKQVTISGTYLGVTKTVVLVVNP